MRAATVHFSDHGFLRFRVEVQDSYISGHVECVVAPPLFRGNGPIKVTVRRNLDGMKIAYPEDVIPDEKGNWAVQIYCLPGDTVLLHWGDLKEAKLDQKKEYLYDGAALIAIWTIDRETWEPTFKWLCPDLKKQQSSSDRRHKDMILPKELK